MLYFHPQQQLYHHPYGLFYPYFYSVVATLGSRDGLAKLDKIYNDDFGYDKEEIKLIWDLYEIKDFRNTASESRRDLRPTASSNTSSSSSGCVILALAISTSIVACLFGIIMIS